MMLWPALFVASWLAATVSGAAGFGGAALLLPILNQAVGVKLAVPLLTVAQLLGNLSRAAFGAGQIRWRPALWFIAGAVPMSIAGSRIFVTLAKDTLTTGLGVVLLLMVVARRSGWMRLSLPEKSLLPAGGLVGFISAVAGTAGPLGAVFFLSLELPAAAYVASEAVTALAMHLTKLVMYNRFALVGPDEMVLGCFLGIAMILGSYSGKRLIERLPREKFSLLVEALMVLAAFQLILVK